MSNNELVLLRRIEELEKLVYRQPEIGGVWQDWTPDVTAGGSMTISSVVIDVARYSTIGKINFINVATTFTLGGSAGRDVNITLPINMGVGRIVMAGQAIMGSSSAQYGANVLYLNSSTIVVRPADGSNWSTGTSRSARVSGFYEIA